jgi:hypothetical protein
MREKSTREVWVPPSQVAGLLDVRVTAEMIRNLRRQGYFTEGVHYLWISPPHKEKPRAQYSVAALNAFFKIPYAERTQQAA